MRQILIALVFVALIALSQAAICRNPTSYSGKEVCANGAYCGECVSFVKVCTGDYRATSQWRRGTHVRGANLSVGTAIATFPGGKYSGHAAIYMGQNSQGIQVYDQWKGRTVGPRTIRWGGNSLVNNGDEYYVIN